MQNQRKKPLGLFGNGRSKDKKMGKWGLVMAGSSVGDPLLAKAQTKAIFQVYCVSL